ncbi:hypothetical protein OR573_08550 [Halomonas sp. CH40]
MNNDDLRAFQAECEAADDYWHEWQFRSKRIRMPADPLAWLNRIEESLPSSLESLPLEARADFQHLIEEQLLQCRHHIARNEQDATNVSFAVLAENIERLNYNISLYRIKSAQAQRTAASRNHRPKARSVLKAKVIDVMRQHRAAGMDFVSFIEMWESDPLDGLRLTPMNDSYLVEDEDAIFESSQIYKYSTIKDKLWPLAKSNR